MKHFFVLKNKAKIYLPGRTQSTHGLRSIVLITSILICAMADNPEFIKRKTWYLITVTIDFLY